MTCSPQKPKIMHAEGHGSWCMENIVNQQLVLNFYSAAALPAMQSALLATADLSVCLSVRPFVTFQGFAQMNKNTIMRSSVSGSTMTLVSEEVKFIRTFARDHPSEGVKVKYPCRSQKFDR